MSPLRNVALALTALLATLFVLGVLLVPRWSAEAPGTPAVATSATHKPCAPRVYPPESLAAGEQGIARVDYETGPDGAVTAARIGRSSGHARLDAASLAHIRRCHFRADVRQGSLLYKWVLP